MKAKANSLEGWVATIITTFQMMSTFLPLENYLAPQRMVAGQVFAAPNVFLPATLTLVITIACLGAFGLRHLDALIAAAWRAWPLMLYCAWAFVTLAWSSDPAAGFNRCGRLLVIVAYPIYLVERFDYQELLRLLTRCFAIWLACSYAAVLLVPSLGMSQLNGYVDAWRGASNHKNGLGATGAIGLAVLAEAWRWRVAGRAIIGAMLLAGAFLLAKSSSATGMVAVMTCVPIFALTVVRHPLDRGMLICLGIALLPAVVLLSEAVDLSSVIGRNTTLTGRTPIWAAVWTFISQRPVLGWSYGFWSIGTDHLLIDRLVGDSIPHSHSGWLDVWVQLGLPGLLLILYAAGRSVVLCFQVNPPGGDRGMTLPLLLTAAVLVRSLAETTFSDPAILSMFWFALAHAMLVRESTAASSAGRRVGGVRSVSDRSVASAS